MYCSRSTIKSHSICFISLVFGERKRKAEQIEFPNFELLNGGLELGSAVERDFTNGVHSRELYTVKLRV